jgi:RNA polymerase sigma-70 factor, ECF subfamily
MPPALERALSDTASAARKTASFRAIFQAELGYVWGTLRRLGVSDRDAEDVAHDVFLRVYEKLDAYDASRPLRPWLFGFAFRAASDYRRLARHRVEVMGADRVDVAGATPSADLELARAEDSALVAQALEAIDIERRAVLVAYELDECPMKDIAAALEIPVFTAYSRLRVAREELEANVTRLRKRRGDA